MTRGLSTRTWVVVADGRRARFFEEPRKGVLLVELFELQMMMTPDAKDAPRDRPPRAYDRVGPGRHAMTPGDGAMDRAEANFLHAVASQVADAARQHAFDELVLMAPPRALGRLRQALSDEAKACIVLEEGKDRVAEDVATIALALNAARHR